MGKRGWRQEDGVQLPQGAACWFVSLPREWRFSLFYLHLPSSVKDLSHNIAEWLFHGQVADRAVGDSDWFVLFWAHPNGEKETQTTWNQVLVSPGHIHLMHSLLEKAICKRQKLWNCIQKTRLSTFKWLLSKSPYSRSPGCWLAVQRSPPFWWIPLW